MVIFVNEVNIKYLMNVKFEINIVDMGNIALYIYNF